MLHVFKLQENDGQSVIVVREFNTVKPEFMVEANNCTKLSNSTIPCKYAHLSPKEKEGSDMLNQGKNPPLPADGNVAEFTRPPLIYEKYAKATPAAPLSWIQSVPVEDTLHSDITIVTGYVNIGNFENEDEKSTHTPELYRKWLRPFEKIETPVVAYFTDDEDVNTFKKIRQGKSTYIVKVSKYGLWAFTLLDDIAKIYRQYSYPKHKPYTTVPEYTSAMHAKYEFMAKALKENPFKTNYFCWMDVGLFRNVSDNPGQTLDLTLPTHFDEKRVAYSQINERKDSTVEEIFHRTKVWVCGCIFMAKGTIMKKWVFEYMRYVDKFLMEGIINTDQQVLYGMYMSREERLVDIQVYHWARTISSMVLRTAICARIPRVTG